jgi:hypothetical protein
MTAKRPSLHHDVAGALEVADEPLGDDVGHEGISVMPALPTFEFQIGTGQAVETEDHCSGSSGSDDTPLGVTWAQHEDLGHRNISNTVRYTELAPGPLQEPLERLSWPLTFSE